MSNNFEDVAQILDTVSEKIPALIRGTIGSLYAPETGAQLGQAVGAFYKELVASGIPAEDALKMAKDYMLTIKNIVPDSINKQ